jgi:hypothetical protein
MAIRLFGFHIAARLAFLGRPVGASILWWLQTPGVAWG